MAVDLIRSRLLWSRLESRAPALDACRLDPAQGGLGDAPTAAPRSRCRLRSGESGSTHLVELVPYSCASAHRGGLDSGGVRRRPGRIARNANEVVRKSCDTDRVPPFGTSRRMPDPEDLCDLWRRRRGVRTRQPAGSPTRPPASPRASGAGVRAEPRRHGAVARSSQRRPAWRLCAATAHGARRRRPGLRRERWMIATGDNDA